jgi:WD40 repeat protein
MADWCSHVLQIRSRACSCQTWWKRCCLRASHAPSPSTAMARSSQVQQQADRDIVLHHSQEVADLQRDIRRTLLSLLATAAGCQDGRIVLWDFQTRSAARLLEGHRYTSCQQTQHSVIFRLVSSKCTARAHMQCPAPCSKAVTGIEWSRDGRTLLSGSLDGHVITWHVEDGSQAGEHRTTCILLYMCILAHCIGFSLCKVQ